MSSTLKAYKLRFYPTASQKQQLWQQFGGARWVFNVGLEMISKAWEHRKESLSYVDVSKQLTLAKQTPELGWLKDIDSGVINQKLRDLDAARQNFFRRVKQGKKPGYPKFKKKRGEQSIRLVFDQRHAGKVKAWAQGELVLPKLGKVKLRWSQSPAAMPKLVTVKLDTAGRYWVTMMVEEVVQTLPITGKTVGVDVGIKHLAILSDGAKVDNPKHLQRRLRQLRHQGRALSRKKKGSKRWQRQRLKVARLHAEIRDCRVNALHQASRQIVNDNQVICIESLNIKGMLGNRKLARHLSDAGIGEFHRQLQYKAEWAGRTLIAIDQWFPSSKTCSTCGHTLDELRLDVREWTCQKCGTHHDRDINAAINIEHEGLKQLIPGGAGESMRVEGDEPLPLADNSQIGRHPLKREPGQLTESCLEQGEVG
jgi:putative transposase